MPHKEGTRVETPATLGRKCWAFAYLAQVWPDLKPQLQEVVDKGAGLDLTPLYDAYDYSVPLTMPLCNAQMANCFLNTTYMPEVHNGTCESSIEVRACVPAMSSYAVSSGMTDKCFVSTLSLVIGWFPTFNSS